MKSDLDRLMQERGFDGLVVTGPSANNPVMYYMASGASLGEGTILIKKRGDAPVLIAGDMEREEAAKSGLKVVPFSQYDSRGILNEAKGDRLLASVRLWEIIFGEQGLSGNISIYGREEQGQALALTNAFNARDNGYMIIGEISPNVFDTAWLTKDPDEVERIRQVGLRTVQVVDKTARLLQSHRAENDVLVKDDGSPLTVGDVKRRIRLWLAELELEDPEQVIFAIGRDAGIPHSSGEDSDPIALGKSIVYDIFPRELGGGYFYDFTRTWCVGFAPPEVEKAYRDVLDTFNTVMSEMEVNGLCRTYQQRTCALLEAAGHPTVGSDRKTQKGYVHSLGHGVGLNIHEAPYFGDYEGATDTLVPGCVVTVEPGVYYPDEGFGIRLEDTVWVNPATNKLEVLAPYPLDLVLPLK
jgi:Xaa-Pro aminopeptidase